MKDWNHLKEFQYYKKIDSVSFSLRVFDKESYPETYYLIKMGKTNIEYYWENNLFWNEQIIGIIDMFILISEVVHRKLINYELRNNKR